MVHLKGQDHATTTQLGKPNDKDIRVRTMFVGLVNGADVRLAQPAKVVDELTILHRAPFLERPVRIRPYHQTDRAAIRQLCCETGYLGKPVDCLFQDRELFADLFTNAYLDHQPQWALVAESDGKFAGYLLGAVSKRFDLILMRSGLVTTVKMLLRLAAGRYSGHRRSRLFIRWLLTVGYREQPKHPPNAAHLHCDLERGFRGRGILKKLWNVYEERLRLAGVTQCYGSFFSHPHRRPEAVYARYGFTVFDRRRTTLFEPEIAEPVEVVCVARKV